MTDFLNHLVARSLHPEASLQPRPVARFEAVPLPTGSAPVMEMNEEGPTQPSPVSPLRNVSRETPLAPEMSQSSLKPALPSIEPVPTPHRGRWDTPPRTEILVQSQTIREHTLERVPIPSPILPTESVSAPSAELPKKVQPLSNIPPRPEKPAPHQPLPPQSAPTPPHPYSPTPTPTLITPVIRPSLPVLLPTQPQAAEPASTIHVTIGRVEVRATPAASAQKPTRPPKTSSVMTLDEYLQRRKTGGGT